jgi:hypothetical protein
MNYPDAVMKTVTDIVILTRAIFALLHSIVTCVGDYKWGFGLHYLIC